MKSRTCGEAVMQLLAAYGVDTVFGMAGTMTLELYRGIAGTGIRHVQCRNEQGASLMADGYARATGKPGVCTIIGGPGVTNAATGIAQAYSDSQPMLVLSGASPATSQGKGWGAIHELNDQAAVTAGFTAFSAMVRYPEELPELIARAYAVFGGSRPRPVHLSLPRDVLPTAGRDRMAHAAHAVPADARSGRDRGGRRSSGAGQASADLRRRRCRGHARGAHRHRRAHRCAGARHQCRQGHPAGLPSALAGLLDAAGGEPGRSWPRRTSCCWSARKSPPGDHFLPKLEISGEIIRIDIDPDRTDLDVCGGRAHSGRRRRRAACPVSGPRQRAAGGASARRARGGCARSGRATPPS